MNETIVMRWIAGADEVASETQLSDGWTYAVFPSVAISAIDAAVANCAVKTFHGKKFKKNQAGDYELFLTAARNELLKHEKAFITFTLMESSWKAQYLEFTDRVITNGVQGAGVDDSEAIKLAKHLFPGLITLQRLTAKANLPALDIEVDSDSISKKLDCASFSVLGKSIATGKLLAWAYEAYRRHQFTSSPPLGDSGILALKDAKSRAIQVADVFGNFALAYIFVHLGHTSKSRTIKAEIFTKVFGKAIEPDHVVRIAKLAGPTMNDIEIHQPGSVTFRLGCLPD